jgi:hypothetical protein
MVQIIYEMPSSKRFGDQGKLCKGSGADMPHSIKRRLFVRVILSEIVPVVGKAFRHWLIIDPVEDT